jgi:hypothetical protein
MPGPLLVNLDVVPGAAYSYDGVVYQSSAVVAADGTITGAVEDITSWTLYAVFKADEEDTTSETVVRSTVGGGITVVSGPAGTFRLTLTAAQTLLLSQGWCWALWRTNVGFEEPVAAGKINIQKVARPSVLV